VGVDWLDIRFRLERRFDVRIEHADFDHLRGRSRADLTAGELFEVVCVRLRSAGRPVPPSAWNGVRLELAQALNVSPLGIRRGSWLAGDLGME
jgi:hypothetical protein